MAQPLRPMRNEASRPSDMRCATPVCQPRRTFEMTSHDHKQPQQGSTDRDEDDEHALPADEGDQRGIGDQGSPVQDRGDYGGHASGEGQGEFAGDGYSAQGQFSDQRVAQYGDQGYGQDYGRQGIGWQNRQQTDQDDGRGSSEQRESPGETQRDEPTAETRNS